MLDTTGLYHLSEVATDWHYKKFPTAPIERVGLKLAEETGELVRCIDRIIYAKNDEDRHYWMDKMDEEFGDVLLCLCVLSGRYGNDRLARAVFDKWREVMSRPDGFKEGVRV